MQRYNKFAFLLTAVLCLGLAACGGAQSSSGAASSASEASSVVSSAASEAEAVNAASSETEQEDGEIVRPLDTLQITDPMADGTYAVAIVSGDNTGSGWQVNVELYDYDKYEEEAVEQLAQGDVVYAVYDASYISDYTGIQVERVEFCDGGADINDGAYGYVEGMILKKIGNLYCNCGTDGNLLYYYVGDATIPVADDVVIKDSSTSSDAEPSVYTGGDVLIEMLSTGLDQYNTTVKVESGKVVEVDVIWMP